VIVAPEVWDYYSKMGAEKSWLGFPTGLEIKLASGWPRQRFEGGTTYWKSGSDPIAVRKALDEYIFQDRELLKRLGYPVSEEQAVGSGESDSIQFFQRGVVTCRGDKYEVWVRPESKPQSSVDDRVIADVIRDSRSIND
jgi:uncharacterized protein with LGFP repeats